MTTEERLDRIERKLATIKNRSKRLWLGMILFGAGILISGAVTTGDDVISAREFRVVDGEGEPRAWLGLQEVGSGLVLYDEEGQERTQLFVTEDGPGLDLTDDKGKARARLAVTEVGPGLVLSDEKGNLRTMLGMTRVGPGLGLFDEKGRMVWSAP